MTRVYIIPLFSMPYFHVQIDMLFVCDLNSETSPQFHKFKNNSTKLYQGMRLQEQATSRYYIIRFAVCIHKNIQAANRLYAILN